LLSTKPAESFSVLSSKGVKRCFFIASESPAFIRLLWHDKRQANNTSKKTMQLVREKKAAIENKPDNWAYAITECGTSKYVRILKK